MRVSVNEALSRGWIKGSEVRPRSSLRGGTRARRADPEGDAQVALIAWFDLAYPAIAGMLIHIPNGGSRRHAFEGWRLRQQGVRKGVSDLFLPVPCSGKHGLWIEMKAEGVKKATNDQRLWLEKMRRQGYAAHLCSGFDAGAACINDYLKGYLKEP